MAKERNQLRQQSGHFLLAAILLMLVLSSCRSDASASLDSDLGSSRAIQNKGSDTLVNVALAWAENYRVVKPEIAIAVYRWWFREPGLPR